MINDQIRCQIWGRTRPNRIGVYTLDDPVNDIRPVRKGDGQLPEMKHGFKVETGGGLRFMAA